MVEQMAASQNLLVADLIGNQDALQKIQFQEFVSEEVGSYTLNDILEELKSLDETLEMTTKKCNSVKPSKT